MKIFFSTFVLLMVTCVSNLHAGNGGRPNIVVLVADDLGIGDLGCYGNDTIKTPNIDRLASEGVRLTHHLSAATMCTPSRAALLTGRYAARYGLVGGEATAPVIVHVGSRASLPTSEITIGKALQAANYTTAAVGKWHLGLMCDLFGRNCDGPKQHGFQHFYGIPYTLVPEFRGHQDFWIFDMDRPVYKNLLVSWIAGLLTLVFFAKKFKYQMKTLFRTGTSISLFCLLWWFAYTHYRFHTYRWWQVSPWMDQIMNGVLLHDDEVVEQPLVLDGLMQNLVNVSIAFIRERAKDDKPFFLYHAFAHVHTPMFTHPSMAGRSKHGRYGDNVEEMDEGIGSIMAALQDGGVDENTIVYFLSDHGGHLEAVDDEGVRVGGYNGLYKGGKGQGSSEGAIRVPGIYRWKGHLPPSTTVDSPTSLMDMMPTILDLAGIPPVKELFPHLPPRNLDGQSIANLLKQKEDLKESRVFIHHCRQDIHAIRWSKVDGHVYKMFLKQHIFPEGSHQCGWGYHSICPCYGDHIRDISNDPLLFDLTRDPFEDHPIARNSTEYETVVAHLKGYLSDWRQRVHYPPSQFHSKMDTILSLWLQPFCIGCTRGNRV